MEEAAVWWDGVAFLFLCLWVGYGPQRAHGSAKEKTNRKRRKAMEFNQTKKKKVNGMNDLLKAMNEINQLVELIEFSSANKEWN